MRSIQLLHQAIDTDSYNDLVVIHLCKNLFITAVNPAAESLLGCSSHVLKGQHIGNIFQLQRCQFPFTAEQLDFENENYKDFSVVFKLYDRADNKVDWRLRIIDHVNRNFELTASQAKKVSIVRARNTKIISDNVLASIRQTKNLATDKTNLLALINTIIQGLPGCAHFKEVSSFRYTASNQATMKLLGITDKNDLIGKDDYDIAKLMKWKWPAHFAAEIQDYDANVISSLTPLIDLEEKPYLNAEGEIVINSLTKIPIVIKDEPLGILTFAMDITKLNNISKIRQLYYGLYPDRATAHKNFISHIGIRDYLCNGQEITEKEYDILYAYCQGIPAKVAARSFDISARTFEKRIEIMKNKFVKFDKAVLLQLLFSVKDSM